MRKTAVSTFASIAVAVFVAIGDAKAEPNGNASAPWRRLQLGEHQTPADLHSALIGARVHIGKLAEAAMMQPAFVLSDERTTIELAIATPEELGFAIMEVPLRTVLERA